MRKALPVNRMRPVHPGEILREDFLKPLHMSANVGRAAAGRRKMTVLNAFLDGTPVQLPRRRN